jgi:hypothetical protein
MGQTCTLLLHIDAEGVAELAATGSRVVVAKPAGSAPPNVAWLAIEPRTRISIAWEELYGVFASNTAVRSDSTIAVASRVHPATERRIYTYDGLRFADARTEARIPPGHYDVWNAGPAAATFGLLQAASVDGTVLQSPLNAVVLPADFTADFTPDTRVYVWTQRGAETGAIIGEVPRHAAVLAFGGQHRSRSYRYDGSGAVFVPGP